MHSRKPSPRVETALAVLAAGAMSLVAPAPAKSSARPASAFRIVARSQDELGLWHVTALLPQQQIVNGRATMAAASMLARIDCRQRVLRIDAWSLRAPSDLDADGWRAPSEPAEAAILNEVCSGHPQLRDAGRASPPPASNALSASGPDGSTSHSAASVRAEPAASRRYVAQIGLFPTEAAARQEAAKARAALPQPERLIIDAAPAPGSASAYRALLRAPSLRDARAVCEARRRLSAASTCWVHPVDP